MATVKDLREAVKELNLPNSKFKEMFDKPCSKLNKAELQKVLEISAELGSSAQVPVEDQRSALAACWLVTRFPRLLVVIEPHRGLHYNLKTKVNGRETMFKFIYDGASNQVVRECQNLAFERSTGSSNELNLPGIFLPIKGMSDSGWISKFGLFGSDSSKRNIRYFQREPPVEALYQYILDKMSNNGHSKDCLEKACIFMKELFSRFGNWEQLQISAALGGPIWEEYTVSLTLKEFILTHSLLPLASYVLREAVPEIRKAVNTLISDSDMDEQYYSTLSGLNKDQSMRKDIRDILDAEIYYGNIDKILLKNKRLDKGWRFYRDSTIPQSYRYDNHLGIHKIEESKVLDTITKLNGWLKDHNALCENLSKGDSRESVDSGLVYDRNPDLQKFSDVIIDPLKFGWKDC